MWSTSLPAAATAAIVLLALPLTVTSSPSSSASTSSSPLSSTSSVDCSSRADGLYATGCTASFVVCTAGHSITMACPAGLVYDEDRRQCEYPGNVVACGGEAPVEGSGIEEGSGSGDGSGEGSGVEGSGIEGSGEGSGIEGSGEGSGEIDISGACESRADGFYALDTCSEQFVGCSGGVAWRMGCPASLKYDEKAQICDYPGNVAGCADAEEGSGEEGSGMEEGSGEGSGIEEGSGEGSGTGEEGSGTIDGSGSETLDGSGSDAESDVIVEEKQEIDTEETIVTPTGRVVEREQDVKEIEAEDDIIDDNNSVVVEEAKEEDTVEEYEVDDNTEAVAGPSSTVNSVVAAPAPTDAAPATTAVAAPLYDDVDDTPSCAGRGDGFYARGCSSELLACSNGIAHIMPCPAGLVFDESNQICDYPPHVAACSQRDQLLTDDSLLTTGDEPRPHPEIPRARDSEAAPDATVAAPTTTPVGPTTVTAAAAAAYAATAASPVAADGPRKSRRDARCKSSDGLFSLDCSVEFVMCRGGVATKLECGEAEAFDESSQSCLPLARHPLCFTHAIQKDDVIDDDVQMTKEKDDQADLQMPIDHSFPCSFEGARAESPCADWFRLCEGGRGIEMYCLQGHLFDGETAKCVPAGQLAHCQAQ